MSELTDGTARRSMRPRRPWVLLAALVTAGLTVAALVVAVTESKPGNRSAGSYEAARHSYEMALLQAPDRIDGSFGAYIDDASGGTVYTAYIEQEHGVYLTDGSAVPLCEKRCMTARKVEGGYAITLPVSYNYQPGSQGFEAPFTKNKVVSLTYWDPAKHAARTVTSQNGASVKLPAVLYSRHAESVTKGEVAYTVPEWIRTDGNGHTVVLKEALVWYESGAAPYGMVDLARLTRTEDGFTACLPASYRDPLINEEGVTGTPATVTQERC